MTDLDKNPDCYKQTAVTLGSQPKTVEMEAIRSEIQSTSNSVSSLVKSNIVKELLKVKLTQTEPENITQTVYSSVMNEVKVVLDKLICCGGALEKKNGLLQRGIAKGKGENGFKLTK